MSTKIFMIEGVMGVGKSTFINLIQTLIQEEGVDLSYLSHPIQGNISQSILEPLDDWQNLKDSNGKSILSHFYSDMDKYAYTFQNFALVTKMMNMDKIDYSKKFIFMERSIYSDKIFAENCFANGTLDEITWKVYNECFNFGEKMMNMSKKDIHFVYLECDPDISFERLKKRGRLEESNVTKEYHREIHDRHEEWLSSNKNTIFLDASLPFRDDKESLRILARQLFDQILNKKCDHEWEKDLSAPFDDHRKYFCKKCEIWGNYATTIGF